MGRKRPEVCSIEGCGKTINRDGLCLRHKLLRVNVATVPGGSKAARTGIDRGKKLEANLHRYRDRKQAGDKPSGISDFYYNQDRRKEQIAEQRPDLAAATGRG